ncbi:hypothetical protein [Brevundimonas sp. GCM10030266]|uniref:hypothetical protein n=1 Tax=Brevundimonas sp. GCM10030266 TaxID=3273386 RepID=UPI0036143C12
MVERLDRGRERASVKEDRTARQRELQAQADALIALGMGKVANDDHAYFTECLAGSMRAVLVLVHGEPSAASLLSKQAYEAGRNILPQKLARARAEQVFAQVANDKGCPK